MPVTKQPLVLHVLPYDLPRGAQRYARAMRLLLDGRGATHRTLCIFESEPCALHADVQLGVRKTRLARLGLEPKALLALRAYLSTGQPDILVAHGSEPLKYLAVLRQHRRLIYYKIGVAHAAAHGAARRAAHALLLRLPHVVAGVSQECLDEAHDVFHVPRSRLALIPNGRDPEVFFPEAHPPSIAIVTFVGHLSTSKRPELFIEVIRRLKQAGAAVRGVLIGDGPLLPSLRPQAESAGVELLGQRHDVPELLRQSDVFVFTSVPGGEGMPGVFIEAGLSGLPVVATDVPGARTVIIDGVTGYVVPVDAVDQLVLRVGELVRNSALRARFGAAAREHCQVELSLEASVKRWQALIAELSRPPTGC